MDNLHPTFAAILKPHLQGQRVVRRRDLDRYKALSAVHAELELAGAVLDIGQLDWAVSEVMNRLHEASLDRQFAEEQARKAEPDYPGLGKNVQDSPEPTGQDFDEQEAEREERRQYREWRNDSGV